MRDIEWLVSKVSAMNQVMNSECHVLTDSTMEFRVMEDMAACTHSRIRTSYSVKMTHSFNCPTAVAVYWSSAVCQHIIFVCMGREARLKFYIATHSSCVISLKAFSSGLEQHLTCTPTNGHPQSLLILLIHSSLNTTGNGICVISPLPWRVFFCLYELFIC